MSEWVEEEPLAQGAVDLTPAASAMRTLTVGFLGLMPLLLAYELALRAQPNPDRNTSELLAGLVFTPFGARSDDVRALTLLVAAAIAVGVALRRRVELGPAMARTVLEGVAGALALGPLLLGLSFALSGVLPGLEGSWSSEAAGSPSLVRAGLLLGGGAWEELVFRVGAYSALFLIVRGLASAAHASPPVSGWSGELFGLFGSAALFATIHLEAATGWLGVGGEPFDAATFAWRFLAGVLLGLLFRWRGAGVAAWSHALFNLGIELGIGRWVVG